MRPGASRHVSEVDLEKLGKSMSNVSVSVGAAGAGAGAGGVVSTHATPGASYDVTSGGWRRPSAGWGEWEARNR